MIEDDRLLRWLMIDELLCAGASSRAGARRPRPPAGDGLRCDGAQVGGARGLSVPRLRRPLRVSVGGSDAVVDDAMSSGQLHVGAVSGSDGVGDEPAERDERDLLVCAGERRRRVMNACID